ncbi:unnamed protein product [Pleuronectes platessa]|uniref:C2H2-type domain-containing protein n=1 Tax=Pleuronectes platessa TaxID=8262 RepID=A0A9N7UYB2_PLEPL|nr:unnamed protein product [Pleuronectes platessa]
MKPHGFLSTDIIPDAVALPLSPVLRTAQLMATPMMLPPAPPPVALPIVPIRAAAAAAPESTSAAGGDEQQLDLNSPSEPDLEPEAEPEPEPEAEADPESEQEKAQRLLYCSLCKVAVNSASQLEAHNSGTKHKTMLEARSGVGSIKSFPRPGVKSKVATVTKSATGLQNKTFHCETCDVHVNSETQLKQHISSRRHKDRAAGKPAKPKYSPYSKPQKGPTKQPKPVSKQHPSLPLFAATQRGGYQYHIDLGEGASVSTSERPDAPGSPGSSGRRHQQRFHPPHEPRLEPRPAPLPLPNTAPPCRSAPPRPRACQDLPPTNPICPLLTRWTRAEPLHHRSWTKPRASPKPGRGVVSAPGELNIFTPTSDLSPLLVWINLHSDAELIDSEASGALSPDGFISLIQTDDLDSTCFLCHPAARPGPTLSRNNV